jgi:hypothetical protein
MTICSTCIHITIMCILHLVERDPFLRPASVVSAEEAVPCGVVLEDPHHTHLPAAAAAGANLLHRLCVRVCVRVLFGN